MILTKTEVDENGKHKTYHYTEWDTYEDCLAEIKALFRALFSHDICDTDELHRTIDEAVKAYNNEKGLS